MPMIHWDQFSWEAFATLATGFAAVIAAMIVGLRQSGIADRQAQILQTQVGLDSLKLRSDLFDRRFAVYEETRKLVIHVMAHAAKASQETEREFFLAVDKSIFLFHPAVHERLDDIWKKYNEFCTVRSMMDESYDRTKTYGQENIERKTQLLNFFHVTLANYHDVFGDELRLGG
jgi:hypothetical protein